MIRPVRNQNFLIPYAYVMKNTISPRNLAPSITKLASKQTYYTIRFLADRERVADAYRAYAYFRWVDNTLDEGDFAQSSAGQDVPSRAEVEMQRRINFLERQKSMLAGCYRGEFPHDATVEESMLIELV